MYSEEFMAYLAAYQSQESKEQKKEEKPCFWLVWLKAIFNFAH